MKYSRDYIENKLATDQRWLERAVLAIWKKQTRDEKVNENTNHNNGIGFNGVDGHIMTSFGNQLNRGRTLSPKQTFVARKKMKKYVGQLIKIIGENESTRNPENARVYQASQEEFVSDPRPKSRIEQAQDIVDEINRRGPGSAVVGCMGSIIEFDADGHMRDL